MPSLDDALDNNAAAVLDDIGDTCTYTPKGATAVTRKIIFSREEQTDIPGTPSSRAAAVIAEIADDATLGRTSITFGGDAVTVPSKFGGGGKSYPIVDFIDRSGGWWRVRIYLNG